MGKWYFWPFLRTNGGLGPVWALKKRALFTTFGGRGVLLRILGPFHHYTTPEGGGHLPPTIAPRRSTPLRRNNVNFVTLFRAPC